jgi:D-3-phosphoglycerate dehydrogenase
VISAPAVARDRGITVDEVVRDADADYESLVTLHVAIDGATHEFEGTVFHDGRPRIVGIDGVDIDAQFGNQMLYIRNEDRPGFIGRLASAIGDAGYNIATFALGRDRAGGSAVALIEIDDVLPEQVLGHISLLEGVRSFKVLRF